MIPFPFCTQSDIKNFPKKIISNYIVITFEHENWNLSFSFVAVLSSTKSNLRKTNFVFPHALHKMADKNVALKQAEAKKNFTSILPLDHKKLKNESNSTHRHKMHSRKKRPTICSGFIPKNFGQENEQANKKRTLKHFFCVKKWHSQRHLFQPTHRKMFCRVNFQFIYTTFRFTHIIAISVFCFH